MKIEVFADVASTAEAAATYIADEARVAIGERGRFVLALSGGSTPWVMLRALAQEKLPWDSVHIVQVDERVAPAGDPDRNLARLRENLFSQVPLRPEHIHPMPVESPDLEAAARQYALTLQEIAGSPPRLDLVHLGLGSDGHTASLIAGDASLSITEADVALSGLYQGKRRMTLTYPILNRARRVLWLVTGIEKALALQRLLAGDSSIPAGRVRPSCGLIFADRSAVSRSEPSKP